MGNKILIFGFQFAVGSVTPLGSVASLLESEHICSCFLSEYLHIKMVSESLLPVEGREPRSSSLLCPEREQRVLCADLFLDTHDRQKGAFAEDPSQKARSSANACSKLPNKVVPCSVA